MAVDQGPDPLERATSALRADDDNGWIELSQTIMSRVRTLVSPAEPIDTHGPDGAVARGPRGSTIKVSGRVLTPIVRAAVDGPARATDSIDIEVVDGRCASVSIGLVGLYGSDLQREGREVREAVAEVLRAVLGPDPDFDPRSDILVTVTDVVLDDPHAQ